MLRGVIVAIAAAFAVSGALAMTLYLKAPRDTPAAAKHDPILPHVRIVPIVKVPPPITTVPKEPEVVTYPPSPAASVTAPAEPRKAEAAPDPPSTRSGAGVRRDVCAAYGGHRVDYGRRWRCVYPGRRR